jgi:hypothetical protein
MIIGLVKNMRRLFLNIISDIRLSPKYLFASVFYASVIVSSNLNSASFALFNFSGRPVSSATAGNYDISERVSIYFHSVILLLLLIFAFSIIQSLLKKRINKSENIVLKYSSFTGIIFFVFHALNLDVADSINLIFGIQIVLLMKILFRNIFNLPDLPDKIKDHELIAWGIILSFSFLFLFKELSLIAHLKPVLNPLYFLSCCGSAIVCSLILVVGKLKVPENLILIIVKVCKPVIFIPLVSVLSTEIYLILNDRGIYSFTPNRIYISTIFILFLICAYQFLKFKKAKVLPQYEISKTLGNYYFLVFILTLIAFANYNPFVKIPHDMFEPANIALPVQQFYEFGKIPFIGSFNSHALSEIFFPFIYTVINGFGDLSLFAYNFIYIIISYLLIYLLFKKITRNIYIAFFLTLFFPFTEILIPSYFNIIIIGILVFCNIIKRQTAWNYFWFLSCILFLIIWRVDIGAGVLLAAIITPIIALINYKKDIHFEYKLFFKALLYFTLLFVVIISILLICTHGDVFTKFKEALAYLSSSQSYGNIDITFNKDFPYYAQYFIFPTGITLLFLYLAIFAKKSNFHNEIDKNTFVIFTFLCVFYLVNFQRGLVRHSFVESWDTALSSYAFFIICSSIYIFFNKQSSSIKFIFLVVISSLLIFSFKYPKDSIATNNPYQLIVDKTRELSGFQPSCSKINRVIPDKNYSDSCYSGICNLLKLSLKKDETFIDFSNSPMLYFFSDKENPDYFDQPTLSNHNDYLQNCFLKNISTYKMPYVVFSRYPEEWWDNVDGIPNTLRHYRIAEYIYSHYEPFIIINNYCLWKEKNSLHITDTSLIKKEYILDNYSTRFKEMKSLKYIPYIWGKYDDAYLSGNKILTDTEISAKNETIKANCEKKYFFAPINDKATGNYLLVKCYSISSDPVDVIVQYGKDDDKKGSFTFTLAGQDSPNDYLIRISSQYNWYHENNNWISIYPIGNDILVENIKILKGD